MGDLKGRVGNNIMGIEIYMGKHDKITKKNDNGSRLIKLCTTNDLVITNTKFIHKTFTNTQERFTPEKKKKKL